MRLKILRRAFRDLVYGLHSGYPLCCVLDFLHTHYMRRVEEVSVKRHEEFGIDWYAFDSRRSFQYVPCRLCMARIQVGEKEPVTNWCRCERRRTWLCRIFDNQAKARMAQHVEYTLSES